MLVLIFAFFGISSLVFSQTESHAQIPLSDSIKRPLTAIRADSTGRFVHINRIFIIGNRITRDQIVLRELSIKQGDIVYNTDLASIIDLDKKKLINTRLFNKVEIKTLELEPDDGRKG